ncbi:diguanylate cyclase (GGDEF)-like protein [Sphingomonas faeni]|nr:diguanylate cyclase (GGDEF)-like protein [Sphingomonas faeni]
MHHARPKATFPPAGRSTSDLRLPTAFTLMCGKRPAWIGAKQIAGTGLRLLALCSQEPPFLESQLEAAAATMAELDRHGAKSELERLQQDRISALIRSLPVPFVFVDAQATDALINNDARSLLRLSPTEGGVERIASALRDLIQSQGDAAFHHQLAADPRAAATFYAPHRGRAYKAHTQWIDDGLVGRIWTFHDITEERRLEEALRVLASTDHLTGALNRRAFQLAFRSEVARCRRYGVALSLVMLDLDHFKRVNDTYGHQAGDEVLKETSSLIRSSLRESDIFGRLGGEEFALLLPHTDLDQGTVLAERLRKAIADKPVNVGSALVRITTSVGITTCRSQTDPIDTMMRRADEALYAAKADGRDRVVSIP